jgi:hypothetical protein
MIFMQNALLSTDLMLFGVNALNIMLFYLCVTTGSAMPMPNYPPATGAAPAYRPPGGAYPPSQTSYPPYPAQPAAGHPSQPSYPGYPQGFAPYQQNASMYSQQTGAYYRIMLDKSWK